MIELSIKDYKYYAAVNPELVAIIRKNGNKIILISDMEYGGENKLLRIESMYFELDVTSPFDVSIATCRDQYAGGITFPMENCLSFDEIFSFFMAQSDSKNFWLIDNESWAEIINTDFDEAFAVAVK